MGASQFSAVLFEHDVGAQGATAASSAGAFAPSHPGSAALSPHRLSQEEKERSEFLSWLLFRTTPEYWSTICEKWICSVGATTSHAGAACAAGEYLSPPDLLHLMSDEEEDLAYGVSLCLILERYYNTAEFRIHIVELFAPLILLAGTGHVPVEHDRTPADHLCGAGSQERLRAAFMATLPAGSSLTHGSTSSGRKASAVSASAVAGASTSNTGGDKASSRKQSSQEQTGLLEDEGRRIGERLPAAIVSSSAGAPSELLDHRQRGASVDVASAVTTSDGMQQQVTFAGSAVAATAPAPAAPTRALPMDRTLSTRNNISTIGHLMQGFGASIQQSKRVSFFASSKSTTTSFAASRAGGQRGSSASAGCSLTRLSLLEAELGSYVAKQNWGASSTQSAAAVKSSAGINASGANVASSGTLSAASILPGGERSRNSSRDQLRRPFLQMSLSV